MERGVEAPEAVDRERDERGDVGLDGDVARQDRHRVAELLGERREAVRHHVAGRDPAALGGDAPRDRPADARTGTGHERDLALVAVRHVATSSS